MRYCRVGILKGSAASTDALFIRHWTDGKQATIYTPVCDRRTDRRTDGRSVTQLSDDIHVDDDDDATTMLSRVVVDCEYLMTAASLCSGFHQLHLPVSIATHDAIRLYKGALDAGYIGLLELYKTV